MVCLSNQLETWKYEYQKKIKNFATFEQLSFLFSLFLSLFILLKGKNQNKLKVFVEIDLFRHFNLL